MDEGTAMHISGKGLILISILLLVACDSKQDQSKKNAQEQAESEPIQVENPDVLPYLDMQETKADYALPFCEKKNCIEIEIQTIKTQDTWLNKWIETHQAWVIQNQVGLNQEMTLQQAVNAYIKKSDAWEAEFPKNKAYELHMQTRIASQRNQYVLLQVSVDTKQAEVSVKARQYLYVADRKLKKNLTILDVIQPQKQNALNNLIQQKYQEWLDQQDMLVKKSAPKKLFWGQSDWFFDGEGIGLHYRAGEISEDAPQFDIYLDKAQTQQMLKPDVFQKMF
ncbi:hypothetical protein ACK2M2_03155 [Acinetobacter sp. TY1]|uniref:hypothetical protein n=1 Tax=Acinetobacter sp. TY1 TaxID=3387626 RepID=UPI003AF7299C